MYNRQVCDLDYLRMQIPDLFFLRESDLHLPYLLNLPHLFPVSSFYVHQLMKHSLYRANPSKTHYAVPPPSLLAKGQTHALQPL